MKVCIDCDVELSVTPYKFEGKPLYVCPKCDDEFV